MNSAAAGGHREQPEADQRGDADRHRGGFRIRSEARQIVAQAIAAQPTIAIAPARSPMLRASGFDRLQQPRGFAHHRASAPDQGGRAAADSSPSRLTADGARRAEIIHERWVGDRDQLTGPKMHARILAVRATF